MHEAQLDEQMGSESVDPLMSVGVFGNRLTDNAAHMLEEDEL